MPPIHNPKRTRTSDKTIRRAVEELHAADVGMPGHGGLTPEHIADHEAVDIKPVTIEKRCRALAADGQLESVRGYDCNSHKPRVGYIPSSEDTDDLRGSRDE